MANSYHTRLKIENNTDTDITNISVSEIEDYDWDRHSRPDHNFHGYSIPAHDSKEEREEVNSNASNCPFRMKLTFRDGRECSFRIHQKHAMGGSPGFSHYGRGINIDYNKYSEEGNHGKLVVILTDDQQYLENQRKSEAQRLDKEGYRLAHEGRYEEALVKLNQALAITSQGNNAGFNKTWVLNKLGRYQEAIYHFNNMNPTDQMYEEAHHHKNTAQAELDAIGLKELGDREFNAGRYDSAKVKYQQAYNKSAVVTNKETYANCINKAKTELDAIGLKEQGDTLFSEGRYPEAKTKYQAAVNKSNITANKTTYTAGVTKVQVELDAIGLKELGDREFNAGRYDSAKVKYQQAYNKSAVVTDKETYANCINKAKTELDAIGLKEQGDTLFSEGKYPEAKTKYQAAYDKSTIAKEKDKYAGVIKKAAALDRFNQIVNSGSYNKLEWSDLECELSDLLYHEPNNATIGNIFHIASLRRARYDMNDKLEQADNTQEKLNELRSGIISLIETEIDVLRQLGIEDHGLNEELTRLEEELNNTPNLSVNQLQPIAERIVEIEEEIEGNIQQSREILVHQAHLERGGHGTELRNPQIALILETYTIKGMDALLELRISLLEEGTFHKQIKLLTSKTANDALDLHDIAKHIVQLSNENEITILPILIALDDSNKDGNIVNHWVGLICECYLNNSIIISYFDSDSSHLEGVREVLIESFQTINESKITFKQIEVEQQRYNNCGPELIENIVKYLTGSRLGQEGSLYVHSSLWEQSLILEDIKQSKGKFQNVTTTTLSKVILNLDINDSVDGGNKFAINHSDTIKLGNDSVNLSGISYEDAEI